MDINQIEQVNTWLLYMLVFGMLLTALLVGYVLRGLERNKVSSYTRNLRRGDGNV